MRITAIVSAPVSRWEVDWRFAQRAERKERWPSRLASADARLRTYESGAPVLGSAHTSSTCCVTAWGERPANAWSVFCRRGWPRRCDAAGCLSAIIRAQLGLSGGRNVAAF